MVNEPTVEDTISILRGLKERYEVFHGVKIQDGALIAAATLSNRYITQNLPDVLSVDQVSKLIDQVSGDDPLTLRDRAILEVLYGCGLRVSELCGLDMDRLDAGDGFIIVLGKGGKERIVPFSGAAARTTQRYLDEGRPALAKGAASSAVFLNNRGGRLSRQSVFKMVQKAGLAIGVKDLHPHSLRRDRIFVATSVALAQKFLRATTLLSQN